MELSTRNQLFSAILGGVVSGARAKEGASLRDVIRQCWRITDQSLYFSECNHEVVGKLSVQGSV